MNTTKLKSYFQTPKKFPFFSFIAVLILITGLFVSVIALRENQDRRSRAYEVVTTPGSYGYGIFGAGNYNEGQPATGSGITSAPTAIPTPTTTSGSSATPNPTSTTAPTPLPTNTPTPFPTNTPFPTSTPTPLPTATPTPRPTNTPIPTATPTPIAAVNLALNKPVTAGSTYSSEYAASKAVDGNTSFWASKSTSGTKWLRVDLGASKNISKIVIKHYEGTYTTKNFTIAVSTDGSSWTTVATATNNTAATTTHMIATRTARYVRINITTPAQNSYQLALIREFEIY